MIGYTYRKKKWSLIFFVLIALLLISFISSLCLGSVRIPFTFIVQFVLGNETNTIWENILLNFRLPKTLTAMLAGAALGISGLHLQTFFRNPLAGPYSLGISSGASLGVAIVIFTTASNFYLLNELSRNWILTISSITGALGVMSIMILVSFRNSNHVILLIVGLILGGAISAMVNILQHFSLAQNIQSYLIWSFGSIGGVTWSEMKFFSTIISVFILFSFGLSNHLNVLLLGEEYAKSLGLNLKLIRLLIIINTSFLTGIVTAFCGPIVFIGIIVPHISKMLFATTNHRLLTPIIILIGATTLIITDIIAQLPTIAQTLPLNAINSIFGTPIIIWLLLRKNNIYQSSANGA